MGKQIDKKKTHSGAVKHPIKKGAMTRKPSSLGQYGFADHRDRVLRPRVRVVEP